MRSVLLLAGALAAVHAGAAPRVTLELRPELRTSGATVLLGEVAVVRSPELALVRRLLQLSVGPAPAAGEAARLARSDLAEWLQRRAGLAPDEIAWRGPASTHVVAEGRVVEGTHVAAAAEAHLRDWLQRLGATADVSWRRQPPDLQVPTGSLRLQPRAIAAAAPRPRMLVWVDVWAGNRFVRTVPVGFELTVAQRWSASPLRPDPAGPPAPAADAPLPGEPVGARRLADAAPSRALEVARGQWAVLRSGAGTVVTEARVQVLQDGRRGDKVRVRHAAASAPMLARVSGPGLLEVAP